MGRALKKDLVVVVDEETRGWRKARRIKDVRREAIFLVG